MAELIRFQNITKRFGNNIANDSVSFSVDAGSVHGIVGENGAGKSTIMKIFYGMYRADHGEIFFKEEKIQISTPQDAIRLKIGMVHQHFMLVPTLSVWENVILGAEPEGMRLDETTICSQLEKLQQDFGFQLPLTEAVENLPVGLQQQVEILKLLYRKADTLILDEPTAVLTPQEVQTLFEKLKELNRQGKTIVVITHKLHEVLNFTQKVTIMRQGRVVETSRTSDLTEQTLAEKIIGRKQKPLPKANPANQALPILEIKEITYKNRLKKLSLSVLPGEIVGIAGIDGNGQHEMVELLAGMHSSESGTILYQGKPLTSHKPFPLAIIPPDRHAEGVILEFSVSENAILGIHRQEDFGKGFFLSEHKVLDFSRKLMEEYDVRPRDPGLVFSSLSGGNQQKLVVGRESHKKADCLIACHPTRGVDIGAIEFIHSHLVELKNKGVGILLISSELEEILALSDRVLVIYQGQIVGEKKASDTSEQELGLWMTGGNSATH